MAYRNAEESINQNARGKTWTTEEKQQLGRSVFHQLVSETLINQEAKRNGLGVSPYELRLYVGQLSVFQNEQGKFDPERYKQVLASRRQTPAQFESDLTRRILQEKMVAFVSAGSWSDSIEARNRFNFLRQKRVVEYLYVATDANRSELAQPSEQEIEKAYEDNKRDYAIPQKADVQYIVVDPLKLVSPDSVSAEDARTWYDRNVERFREPESVEVSHILVPVGQQASDEEVKQAREKASAIKKEIDGGRNFAEAADAYNSPNAAGKGGSIGWIEPGRTVPEFEQAAYAATRGVVTEPVRSPFGFHLILVTDRKDASVKSFADAEKDARAAVAAELGKSRLTDVLDLLTEENILGRSLDEAARAQGLVAEKTGLLSQPELERKLGIKPEASGSIMASGVNQPVDVPLEAGDHYVIVRVVATEPASFKPLADVRAEVVDRLYAERGLALARTQLEGVLKQAADGKLPAEWQEKVKTSEPVDRGGAIAPFKAQEDLEQAIFKALPGTWIPTVFAVSTDKDAGAMVCRVLKIQDPSDQEWQQFEAIMTSLLQRERADGLFQAFMEDLFSKSKIVVRNQDLIDRKNM